MVLSSDRDSVSAVVEKSKVGCRRWEFCIEQSLVIVVGLLTKIITVCEDQSSQNHICA